MIVRDRYLADPGKAKIFRAMEMYVPLEREAEHVAQELEMSVDSVHQEKARISKALRVEATALDESAG